MIDGAALLDRLPGDIRELVQRCGEIASERDEEAYLVGGGVRDLILDLEGLDVDVVVVGDGMAVAQALARGIGGELTRYHAFQTARVDAPDGTRIDVATARSEDYPRPGDLPRVREGSLKEDLARRDFTINAMAIALDPSDRGRFVDPHGGRDDLRRGLVRVLHGRSFTDDPTRILRALRFAVRFGYELEARTEAALTAALQGAYLDEISGPRLRREVRKMLAEAPVEGALVLGRRGVLDAIHDGLEADPARLASIVAEAGRLDAAARFDVPSWSLVLAALAAGLEPQPRWEVVERLDLSRRDRRPLIAAGKPWSRAVRAWERGHGGGGGESPPVASLLLEAFDDVDPAGLVVGAAMASAAGRADLAAAVRRYLDELRGVRPQLTGTELMAMGCPPGPRVGELLSALRAAVADGRVEGVEEERRWVARRLAEEA